MWVLSNNSPPNQPRLQQLPQKRRISVVNYLLVTVVGLVLQPYRETRWWFQIFFIFIPTWGNDPIWLIFFKWAETTNLERISQLKRHVLKNGFRSKQQKTNRLPVYFHNITHTLFRVYLAPKKVLVSNKCWCRKKIINHHVYIYIHIYICI